MSQELTAQTKGGGVDIDSGDIFLIILLGVSGIAVFGLAGWIRVERMAAAALARLDAAERRIEALAAERNEAAAARDAARNAQSRAERAALLAQQRIGEFEMLRREMLRSAQSAVLSTAQQLSSKLLEDHKRETEAAKKAGEEKVRQASEQLMKQLEQVANAVAQLEGRVTEGSGKLETVMRALSHPGGAGQFAEIGLANTLKSFGLEEGRDFILQFTAEDTETGRRLRPDAVIFLPGCNLLVIDSKASKFLLEMAEAEGTEAEAAACQNLARTMKQHLKALADKDYRKAVAAAYRNAGYPGEIGRVLSVMYLPNEAAVEKLNRIDPDFAQRAAAAQIIPTGPAGLACIIGFASSEISLGRQARNREQIIETTRALIESITQMLVHAAAFGRGLRSASESYEKFIRSVNRFVLPRARRLGEFGVQPDKALPGNLPMFQVVTLESDLIEGEAEEMPEPGALEAAESREADVVPLLPKRRGDG
jgi:DNA recombination protein RmuC